MQIWMAGSADDYEILRARLLYGRGYLCRMHGRWTRARSGREDRREREAHPVVARVVGQVGMHCYELVLTLAKHSASS